MQDDWRGHVYKMHEINDMSNDEWLLVRDAVLRRDNFTCLRCDKRFKRIEITAHHMQPRSEGGSNELSNLVSLCNTCHDYVEVNELKTRAAIMGSLELESEKINFEPPKVITWQMRVYGGYRGR